MKIAINEIQGGFQIPPASQGQIVVVSYATTEDYILRKVWDRSIAGNNEVIHAYEWPDSEVFEPQNEVPELGEFVDSVELG